MSDALCGQWYCKACGLPDYIDDEMATRNLETIFEHNVYHFGKERRGAVNGSRIDSLVDLSSLQSKEVWPGVVFGLSATMIHYNMDILSFKTTKGMVQNLYDQLGYQFQIPEALDQLSRFRAHTYQRSLSIWAIQSAIQQRRK
jgi:non-lysosomal glucosylceramidase